MKYFLILPAHWSKRYVINVSLMNNREMAYDISNGWYCAAPDTKTF